MWIHSKNGGTAFALLLVVTAQSWLTAAPSVPAAKQKIRYNPATLDYGQLKYVGNTLDLSDGVKINSSTYDLSATTMKISLAAKGAPDSPGSISRAVATGGPTTDKQVVGRFDQIEEERSFRVQADRAVYVPDPSRIDGGRIDFTGHVKWVVSAPAALAEDSVTTTDHLTVLVGHGRDYPQVETGPGHMTVTPKQ